MRLEQLEEEMGSKIEIIWRSFLLRPMPEERSMEKFVAYTESWRRPAEMEPLTKFNVWATDNPPPSHSMPPLVASKAVEEFAPEHWHAFHKALMKAYFVENRNITDVVVQLEVAAEVGIDTDTMRDAISNDVQRYTVQIFTEHNEAVQAGITGIPAVVMPGGFVIPGAQDVATYRNITEKFIEQAEGVALENP